MGKGVVFVEIELGFELRASEKHVLTTPAASLNLTRLFSFGFIFRSFVPIGLNIRYKWVPSAAVRNFFIFFFRNPMLPILLDLTFGNKIFF